MPSTLALILVPTLTVPTVLLFGRRYLTATPCSTLETWLQLSWYLPVWSTYHWPAALLITSVSKQLRLSKCLLESGNPYWRGRISTADLLVLTCSYQLLYLLIWDIDKYRSCLQNVLVEIYLNLINKFSIKPKPNFVCHFKCVWILKCNLCKL
jgi:hypothetical protein